MPTDKDRDDLEALRQRLDDDALDDVVVDEETLDESSDDVAIESGTSGDEAQVTAADASASFLGQPAARRGRSALGMWLLGLGGGVWALFGIMRCSPPAGPELAMERPELPEIPQPPLPSLDEATPEPAATRTKDRPAPKSEETAPPSDDEPDNVEAVPPHPKPAPWARDVVPPETVTYTIQRGGAMKNVANLYKIYHHEIIALNPGFDLDQELPPKTKIVVYRQEQGERSESVGLPSAGSLEGAVPMMYGPGRLLKMIPWKSWGTGTTVALLDRVLVQWTERGSKQPILVGNLSSRHGGRLEPHGTHQSGRDVDLGYPQKLPPGEELNWREMNDRNLDRGETWALMFLLAQTGAVEVMFMDRSLQKLMYEYALEQRLMSKRQLAEWLEYPRPTGSGSPMVRHVNGHIDHLHVRFACQPHESRCESRG